MHCGRITGVGSLIPNERRRIHGSDSAAPTGDQAGDCGGVARRPPGSGREQQRGSRIARAAAISLELLFGAAALVSVTLLVVGHLNLGRAELRSAMPTVVVMTVAGLIRLGNWRRIGLLFSRFTPDDMSRASCSFFRSVTAPGDDSHPYAWWRLVFVLVAASFFLKAANACAYRGFFSGDDVEVLEWVLSRIQGWHYSPWVLRNPFFPFSFVFPPLWLAHRAGLQDTWTLVLLARLWIALFSSLAVVLGFLIGRKMTGSSTSGVFVAAVVAFGGYFIRFSSGVLPRSAAAVPILAALWLLLDERDGGWRPALAGALVGISAAARFSEAAFVVAGLVVLAGQRRWRSFSGYGLTAVVATVLTVGGADFVFTGNPLSSVSAIWRFTLVEGASSRGFQPWYSYIGYVVQILTPIGAVFACWAIKRSNVVLWTWCAVPTLLLSLLPHKEIRYLTALMPAFLVLLALGSLEVMRQQRTISGRARSLRWWSPAIVVVLLLGTALLQLDSARFRRSGTPVEAARWITQHWTGQGIALEQLWRAGGRLFLPKDGTIIDLEPPGSTDLSGGLHHVLTNPQIGFLGLTSKTLAEPDVEQAVNSAGFRAVDIGEDKADDYRLFTRPTR